MGTGDAVNKTDERNELRQAGRYPLAVKRDCEMCIITFKDFDWKDHVTLLKDISMHGVGVESNRRIGPGFVWFRDRVSGHRGGVLLWSRQVGRLYRAGIQFVPLSHEAEQFIHSQVDLLRANQPLRYPQAILSMIMGSIGPQKH
jgi:hypothetical protein